MDAPQVIVANATSNTTGNSQPFEEQSTVCSTLRGKSDSAWDHFAFKKERRVSVYTCLQCGNVYNGGDINRMKQRLAHVTGQISPCSKVPYDVQH